MNAIYRSAAAAVAVAAASGLLTGLAAGTAAGWAVSAIVLLVAFAYHVWHLARLARWLSQPSAPVPEGHDGWDEVLSDLYRHVRNAARREQVLANALERFKRAAQALPDGVVLLDAEDRIEWCNDNAAQLLELDLRADTGEPIANLLREPGFVAHLAAAGAQEAPVRVPRPDGRALSLHLIPYSKAQKLLLCRDVTQLERQETMRRDFVANVSHELRTPLTVLVGFLETVRDLQLDPQRTRDYLAMMGEQSSRMHHIIEDLLTLSLIESAPPPSGERVRVAPLLARLRADAEALSAGRHQVRLQGEPRRDLLGSEAELASAFGNLVSNAIRYTPKGGTVTLSWLDGAQGAKFTVADSGPGIAAEHIPRLTERFSRVDRSRSRETGGTGLGLAIVKHAASRHQATLDIDSKPGSGSRFTLRFPLSRTVPAAGSSQAA